VFLELSGIHVHYGVFEAVRGVSMQIPEGSIIGLLGANGSGKSTILKTISGLKRPTRGEIRFNGKRIDGKPTHKVIESGIAHVPEGRRLFPLMTVGENLELGAYLRKDKKEIRRDMEEMAEHFPILKKRWNQRAGNLSGGEQEMLAIARALMVRPKLLLMDEPLQGLAPAVQEDIKSIIHDLNIRGLGILMVEHNVHMTLGMSHSIFILEVGQVILNGSPTELSESEYVQKVYLGG